MNKKAWFKKFRKRLSPLRESERTNAIMYYDEMYFDRIDAGMREEAILYEFGSPDECANRILTENGINPYKVKNRPSIASMLGIGLFLAILGLPLVAVILSVIIAFVAVAITGAALSVGGVLWGIISTFTSLSVLSPQGVVVQIGLGIACSGVGVLLFIGFGLLSKWAIQSSVRGVKWIFKGRSAV